MDNPDTGTILGGSDDSTIVAYGTNVTGRCHMVDARVWTAAESVEGVVGKNTKGGDELDARTIPANPQVLGSSLEEEEGSCSELDHSTRRSLSCAGRCFGGRGDYITSEQDPSTKVGQTKRIRCHCRTIFGGIDHIRAVT